MPVPSIEPVHPPPPSLGAVNAALLAAAILGTTRSALRERLRLFRSAQTEKVLGDTLE